MNTRNLPLLPLALLSLLALAAQPACAERTIREAADVHPQGEVEISNVSGRIDVEAWDQDRVEVTGTLGRGAERLEFKTRDRHTLVQVVHPSESRNIGPSELVVRMPRASRLVVVSVSADVMVRGVHGAQRVQSVSGDITTAMVKEDVQLKTVTGDIQVDGNDSPGLLTITTVSGDANVRAVAGEVILQTVSGKFDIDSDQLARARIRTTNGDAFLRSGLAKGARVEMEAVSGTLNLVIADEPDAEFTIETLNGEIDNAFGPEPVRTSRYGPGSELRFTTGAGSARVTMETINGDIILRAE